MNQNWIIPKDILLYRLDAEFYDPIFVEHARFIVSCHKNREFGIRSLGKIGKLFTGPFGSKLPATLYRNQGVPLIRVQNTYPFFLKEENLVFLDESDHKDLKTSEVVRGDLMISKAGRVGDACLLPPKYQKGNITEHVIGVRLHNSYDPFYFITAINSMFANLQFRRFGLGTLINYLGVEATRTVEIPFPGFDICGAIGNYVRKAERLRETAKAKISQAGSMLDNDLKWQNGTGRIPRLSAWVESSEMHHRLDGQYNSPQRIGIARHLRRNRINYQTVQDVAQVSAMIGWKGLNTEHYTETGPYLIRGVDFDNGILNTDSLIHVDQMKYDEQPQIHLRAGDVIMTKDGTIGRALIVPDLDHEMCAGSTVARLRLENDLSPYYFEAILNHEVVQLQIQSFATGLAQPHITQEWINELLIPILPSQYEIAQKIESHHDSMMASSGLVKRAVECVDDLIDGTLDEKTLLSESAEIEKWLKENPSPYEAAASEKT